MSSSAWSSTITNYHFITTQLSVSHGVPLSPITTSCFLLLLWMSYCPLSIYLLIVWIPVIELLFLAYLTGEEVIIKYYKSRKIEDKFEISLK